MAVKKKKFNLDDIITLYERKQLGVIKSVMQQIMALFDDNATKLAFLYAKRRLVNNRFLPRDVRQAIDRVTNTVNAKSKDIIINGIRQSFIHAEEKNDKIKAAVLGSGRRIPPGLKKEILGSHKGRDEIYTAVDAYVKRKTEGLGLSKRIWKLAPSFKKAMNDTFIEELGKGTSAKEIAKTLRSNLRSGEMVEKPGQGKYKSPEKNALRVARNEINIAYANADHQRWQGEWFIIGIEVKLSNRHIVYDICDSMKGKYPKDFHFVLWHANCLCIAIPVLASQEIRDEYMDWQLGLRDTPPVVPYIKTMPAAATEWMKRNAARVNGWKSKPFWIGANKLRVGKYFS
jgi:hypothetical protein